MMPRIIADARRGVYTASYPRAPRARVLFSLPTDYRRQRITKDSVTVLRPIELNYSLWRFFQPCGVFGVYLCKTWNLIFFRSRIPFGMWIGRQSSAMIA